MVDLKQLAVQRDGPTAASVRRRTPWVSRYLLPAIVLAGFAGVMVWAARDQWRSARKVTVVPVLATRATVQQEGTPLFTAAGWVEPRPTPVLVSALAEGIVEKLLVVEDQLVKAGDEIAHLVRRDAELELAQAEASLSLAQAETKSAAAAFEAARTNLEYPVVLDAMLADAEAMLVKTENELAAIPFQLRAAESRAEFAQADLQRKRNSGAGVSAAELQKSLSEDLTARADVDELKIRQSSLEKEVKALGAKRDAVMRQSGLKTEEKRRVAETEAARQAADAKVRQAEVARATAKLKLERMIVRAPAAGRVLGLIAMPGTPLQSGMRAAEAASDESGGHYASTVVTLYDPQRLQVRGDVRLENVPQVTPGQKVRIETDAYPKPLFGEVLFATAITNVQKNTLQVKVSIDDPPPSLKPAMLVTLTFLAPPSKATPTETPRLRVYVPRSLVQSTEGGASVWIVDAMQAKALRRSITLGSAISSAMVEVVSGLTPADKLIVSGREELSEGDLIEVTGEDTSLTAEVPAGTANTKTKEHAEGNHGSGT